MEKEKRTATIKTKINKYYPANVNEKIKQKKQQQQHIRNL